MKIVRVLGILLPAMLIPLALEAQNDSIYNLTLDQAKQLALQNNLELQNASLDVKAAKRKVWETTAMGLPHASGSGSFSYMLTIPSIYKTFIEQGIPEGTPDNIKDSIVNATLDDMRASTAFDLNVSQLIFSGSYIVGLQASKIYKNLSTYSYESTQDNVLENVINAYASVLVAKENIDVLKKTLSNVEETSDQMKKMYEAGLIDEISYNQVAINRLTLKNSLSQIERQYSLVEKLLKYQLGLNFNDSLILSENLDDVILQFEDVSYANTAYSLESDVNYKLIKTQEELMKQNYNLNKTYFLPTISGYYAYHKNLNSNSVDFQPQDIVGIQVSVPIFSSGERIAQLSQAKISYEQAKNKTEMGSEMLTIGVTEAKSSYISALNQIEFNRENLQLATKVYDQTLEKNKLGMASSTDLSQAQVQLLTVQGNYYMAVFQLVSAKVALDKAYNKL
jgi:outer membrane protein